MPINILPDSSFDVAMQLIDNLGNTYTIKPGTLTVAIDNTAIATLTGTLLTAVALGTTKLRYSCTSLLGTPLSGEDDINVVSTLPQREDATAVWPLYSQIAPVNQ